ncbi:hypothetical protein Tco_0976525 [Tanacetum coccineum]|uniref:Uncharacterized protein n=1 Tax=Tanacetum coccineum TaxID=301880 RepID=A0ABQ5EHK6_9ASTR
MESKGDSHKEAKDLATLPLDELIGNLKFYEMILENDGVASKTTKENVKPFNLMAMNFRKFFRKGNQFGQGNRFGNGGEEGHFIGECPKPKENKAFDEGAWSDREDRNEPQNDATCLMAVDSQEVQPKPSISNNDLDIIELQKENEKLLSKINELELEEKKLTKSKEVIELCQKCELLTQEVDSLKCNVSKLQDKALNFSKFKKSSIVLEDMLTIKNCPKIRKFAQAQSSPSVEDDRIKEPIVQDLNGSPSSQFNVSDEGYPKSVK